MENGHVLSRLPADLLTAIKVRRRLWRVEGWRSSMEGTAMLMLFAIMAAELTTITIVAALAWLLRRTMLHCSTASWARR